MKNHQIYSICGTEYKEMTKKLLESCDLKERILNKAGEVSKADRTGEAARSLTDIKIGIKPNLVSPSEASWGATTHPEIVAGIIEYLKENEFCNVVMMEGSWVGDKTEEAYEVCGFRELSEKYDIPFLDMQKEKGVETDCAGMNLKVCAAVKDIDFLINVPVLKGHCQTKITCALKNMKGLIPNSEKRRFHSLGLHKPIAHLNVGIHQDFVVVDNICGDLDFEDGGNPVVMNRILAAADPVLVDAYVCKMMHYNMEEVPYVKIAGEIGAGCADVSKAEIILCGDTSLEDSEESRSSAGADVAGPELMMPKSRKVVELKDAVEEVESCSACYGYLIPALDMLKQEGLFDKLRDKICIGQGYRGQTGKLGIGNCTRKFEHHLGGCPPLENEIYAFLKEYIEKN